MNKYDETLIVERIYKYRQELNHLSLKNLSELSGVSASHIGDMERGKNSPSNIDILYRLANALNIRIDDLLVDCLIYYESTNKPINNDLFDIINGFTVEELAKINKMCDIILSNR